MVIRLIFTALILAFSLSTSAQITVSRERTRIDNAGDMLHKIANEFSDAVGGSLKKNYPARVERVDVRLICTGNKMTLQYEARLVPCTEEEADYYFDHRGSFSVTASEHGSSSDADRRVMTQVNEARPKFDTTYGKGRTRIMMSKSQQESCMHSSYYGAITEAFFIVKR